MPNQSLPFPGAAQAFEFACQLRDLSLSVINIRRPSGLPLTALLTTGPLADAASDSQFETSTRLVYCQCVTRPAARERALRLRIIKAHDSGIYSWPILDTLLSSVGTGPRTVDPSFSLLMGALILHYLELERYCAWEGDPSPRETDPFWEELHSCLRLDAPHYQFVRCLGTSSRSAHVHQRIRLPLFRKGKDGLQRLADALNLALSFDRCHCDHCGGPAPETIFTTATRFHKR